MDTISFETTNANLLTSLGLLICGPSGTGKTAMIRFIMNQLENRFKVFEVQCADLIHKVLNTRGLF